jgi:hypothetical protein
MANSDETVHAAVIKGAAVPRTSSPEEFGTLIKADTKIWTEIVSRLHIKLD